MPAPSLKIMKNNVLSFLPIPLFSAKKGLEEKGKGIPFNLKCLIYNVLGYSIYAPPWIMSEYASVKKTDSWECWVIFRVEVEYLIGKHPVTDI